MDTKSCCAGLYASDSARLLLGDVLHPGGLALTERLGVVLGLESDSRVLDLASGAGTSAICLARTFGCEVTGVDYSLDNVALSTKTAKREGLSDRVAMDTNAEWSICWNRSWRTAPSPKTDSKTGSRARRSSKSLHHIENEDTHRSFRQAQLGCTNSASTGYCGAAYTCPGTQPAEVAYGGCSRVST
jgi:hypothetical protein